MTARDPTEPELRQMIRDSLGVEVDVIYCDEPAFIGSVSLLSFGTIGFYAVFKHQGKVVATPVPFGLSHLEVGKAA